MLGWILFPRELREAIYELKSKNDFRPKGLRRVYLRFWLLLILSMGVLYLYLFIKPDEHFILLFSVFLAILAIKLPRSLAKDRIIAYSTGCVVSGEYSYVKYVTPAILNGGNGFIGCTYIDDNSIAHKRSWGGLVTYWGRKHVRAVGEKVPIFYTINRPEDGIPYLAPVFNAYCISKSRMNIDWDQYLQTKKAC
ncbi:hypothetical protein [Pseudemcibacter aquimaris]|uniref:hypothetical protein n=1 Tax=Pseudemcibacter aquimaris TaxID=2857064 RepID=UPI00201239D4|nr:hypothetical protein [Pseudemcibacter aquimaris]MCC3861537.1 hypothetical protein [Pseudemcibacter aquimaris]WDU58306.1 hypothetical protein KW060_14030 [Pseudemcibacter aquimaris]